MDEIRDFKISYLQKAAYSALISEKRDIARIDKIIRGIKNGEITKENYWDSIRGFTKRVYSDHSIGHWQCIAEWFWYEWFEKEED